jgi:hypothetical protein
MSKKWQRKRPNMNKFYSKRWQFARLLLKDLLDKEIDIEKIRWQQIHRIYPATDIELILGKDSAGNIFKAFHFPTLPYFYYSERCEVVTDMPYFSHVDQ